jgi:hypothetical protein
LDYQGIDVLKAPSSIAAELRSPKGDKKWDLKAKDGVPFDPRRAKVAANYDRTAGYDDVDFHARDTTVRK